MKRDRIPFDPLPFLGFPLKLKTLFQITTIVQTGLRICKPVWTIVFTRKIGLKVCEAVPQ